MAGAAYQFGAGGTDTSGAAPGTNQVAIDQQLGLSSSEAVMPVTLSLNAVLGTNTNPAVNPSSPYDVLAGPGYSGGDQRTLRDALYSWYSMDPDRLQALQTQLYNAGFYGPSYYKGTSEVPLGDSGDSGGFSAFRKALRLAALSGKPLTQVIDDQQKATGGAPALRAKNFSPTLTNAEDLKAVIKSGAQKVLGKNVSDEEANRIVAAYQQSESAADLAAFNANQTGGATEKPANPTDFVNQQLQQLHPDQAAATTFNDEANAFLQVAGQTPHI